ncbi:MAG: hypothetical protein DRI84_08580 [Bacteroidetes bacterium]|nr:MAG: hypothetical protein DRI84_08580 [Bacteroidota bacterium]
MQRNKSTKKVEQIEKISQSGDDITYSITSVMNKFGIKSVIKPFDVLKRSGALVSTITMTLIILPFITKGSVWDLFSNGLNKDDEGKKDSFYELKNNTKVNWRALLYGIAKRFQVLASSSYDEATKQIRAIILDDTTVTKTGKHIEGTGYVHDHVSGRFVLGFKILVSGYWDGVSFIPIDFSIHREKRDGELKKAQNRIEKKKDQIKHIQEYKKEIVTRIDTLNGQIKKLKTLKPSKTHQKQLLAKMRMLENNQNKLTSTEQKTEEQQQSLYFLENTYYELKKQSGKCGLKVEEYSEQFKKQRQRNTAGYKRKKEIDSNKIDSAISMIKRALRNGFEFEYVLTDSWFFCGKLLKFIDSLGKKIHLVSMAKMGNAKYKLLPSNKYMSSKQILALYKRKVHANRRYKAKYIKIQVEYQGIRIVLFFVNIGKGENWRLLVSTDNNISFNKLMEVYKIRWTIEVFFKEAKQYLLLGKSQSQYFDAQIADTTLSFIRYILLSYYERIHYGMSIGGLFQKLSQASVEENLVADLSHIFMNLLQAFAQLAGIDFMTLYEELIRKPQCQESINKLKLFPQIMSA